MPIRDEKNFKMPSGLNNTGQVAYLLIMKRGPKPVNESWYVNQVLQKVVSKESMSSSSKIKARWQTGHIDQNYAITAALIDFGEDVGTNKYDLILKEFWDADGDGGMVLIAYHKNTRAEAQEGIPQGQQTDLPQEHFDCDHSGTKYICRICRKSFCYDCLNKHALFIGNISRNIAVNMFGGSADVSGTVYTFDNQNLAWCPNCVRTFQQMKSLGRTIKQNQ